MIAFAISFSRGKPFIYEIESLERLSGHSRQLTNEFNQNP